MSPSTLPTNATPIHQRGSLEDPASGPSDRFFDALEETVHNLQAESTGTTSENGDEAVFDETSSIRDAVSRLKSFRARHIIDNTPATSDVESEQSREIIPPGGRSRNQPVQEGLDEIADLSVRPQQVRALERIQGDQFTYPKSKYEGNECGPIFRERDAIHELFEALRRKRVADVERTRQGLLPTSPPADFSEFELTEFSIYLPEHNKFYANQLRGLQNLGTKNGHSMLLFDGYLSAAGERRYVQGVPFEICCIGNYGEDMHAVGDEIWIQSAHNPKSKLYYRLKDPASEYTRYHLGFVWLADLAKHFVDYTQSRMEGQVSIHDFRDNFSQWLLRTHGESLEFQSWYQQYRHNDFRTAIVANVNFLFKESVGVDSDLRELFIWKEILEKDAFPENHIQETKTVVTPYVYNCFSHLKFGHHLKAVEPISMAQSRRTSQGLALHLTVDDSLRQNTIESKVSKSQHFGSGFSRPRKPSVSTALSILSSEAVRRQKIKSIRVGDVLAVTKDGDGSVWKDEVSRWKAADEAWYILVQAMHTSNSDKKTFDGIWLYRPSDTSCAKMKYPFPNELFLSDNCTCLRSRITEDEILHVVPVSWHGNPNTSKDFFIRQTYLENEKFVTLKDSHKRCEHFQEQEHHSPKVKVRNYAVGQTVLVPPPRRKGKHALEPYELTGYAQDGLREFAILRRLLRRVDVDGKGRPNELVYSDEIDKTTVGKIDRPCLVRFYSEADAESKLIPAPYGKDGTANAFYISTRLVGTEGEPKLVSITDDIPKSLIQGFDPDEPLSRELLRGMDLYCGGGNFGRGLEDGGALHNVIAVDIMKTAIHTYYANLKDRKSTNLYHGSVDDLLYMALQGNPNDSELVPLPGDIDFISAGSPCQGFSNLNSERNNEKGLKNQSLVASVAAYVDFYRPKYGLLENVMNMAQKGRGRDEDVLSQLICAIVGMGYQLQLFVLDAWSFGSPQSRSRLFVSFSAPGCEPLEHPDFSHSHPPHVADRGLGKLANGQSFGQRLHPATPFEYVGAGEATKDLPNIGDGATYHCIPFSDHVMSHGLSDKLRLQMAAIPMHPKGMNFVKSWNNGNGPMTKEERQLFPSLAKNGKPRQAVTQGSRAWGRVNPQGLFGTVVVSSTPPDSRMGNCLHWEQQRVLTVMELRRAQGFLDDDVLVGSPSEQLKMVGNSVARTVSLALGLSLRKAWLRSPSAVDFKMDLWGVENRLLRENTAQFTELSNSANSASRTPLPNGRQSSIQIVIPSAGSRHLTSSLPMRPSVSPEEVLPRRASNKPSAATTNLKRSYGTIGEIQSLSGQNHKILKLANTQSSSSRGTQTHFEPPNSFPTSSETTRRRRPSFDELTKTLRDAKDKQLLQNPNYFADDDDTEESDDECATARLRGANEELEEVDADEEAISMSPTSFASNALRNRFESRKIVTPRKGKAKAPSGSKMSSKSKLMAGDRRSANGSSSAHTVKSSTTSKSLSSNTKISKKENRRKETRRPNIIIKIEPGIINLVSDDDEPVVLSVQSKVNKPEPRRPSPEQNYVSVDNNIFSPYAKTNKLLHADKNRKH